MRMLEHVDRHLRHAAELARQRPFGAGAVAQDAAEHLHVLGAGDAGLLGARAIFSTSASQSTAKRRTPSSRARAMSRSFLIVLPKEIAVRRGAGVERQLDLDDRGRVEARAELGEELEHLRRRVRLHGVEHARVGQGPGELGVVVAHDIEVDDQARAVLASVAQEFADALSHGALPTKGSMGLLQGPGLKFRRQAARRQRGRRHRAPVRWRHESARWVLHPTMLPWIGKGRPLTARPAMRNKPLRCRPLEGQRDQKSPFVVALSRVPR